MTDIIPHGEWKAIQIADTLDVQEGRSDLPCMKIIGPDGIEGIIWGFTSPKVAIKAFVLDLFETYPRIEISEKYYT